MVMVSQQLISEVVSNLHNAQEVYDFVNEVKSKAYLNGAVHSHMEDRTPEPKGFTFSYPPLRN